MNNGEKGVDIVGEENSYEVFPYRLKIDPDELGQISFEEEEEESPEEFL